MAIKVKVTKPTATTSDDTQTVSSDINELYKQFIQPIDRYRSFGNAPGLYQSFATQTNKSTSDTVDASNINGIIVNPDQFTESRTHAFYRMVGFPVATKYGGYYNPGFNPSSQNTINRKKKVNQFLNSNHSDIIRIMQKREQLVSQKRSVFITQDNNSTAYATCLKLPKLFLIAQVDQDPFYADIQSQVIDGRLDLIRGIQSSTLPYFVISPEHLLKPFLVNPSIEEAVSPSSLRICVPFLPDINSTKITESIYLKRSILEYILIQRLSNQTKDETFINEANRLITNSNEANKTNSEIRDSLLALSGKDNISLTNDEILSSINGFSQIQSKTILLYTKIIKSVVSKLDSNIREFELFKNETEYYPIPSTYGPEFGCSFKTINNKVSKFDQNIAELRLIDYLNRMKGTADSVVGGQEAFVSIVSSSPGKDFSGDLNKITRQRDELGNRAGQLLKEIEIITGEVSGLGLIDVLAIYTALWSVNIDILLGLLDNESIDRLTTYDIFKDLVTSDVINSKNNRPNITETLKSLETIIFNILSFADNIYKQKSRSPLEARIGNVK
jgi:hypothetical protein